MYAQEQGMWTCSVCTFSLSHLNTGNYLIIYMYIYAAGHFRNAQILKKI